MSKWSYTRDFAEFTLEQINPSVVKVTYRDQTGYFGITTHWDVMRPYTLTTLEAAVRDDGVDTMGMGYQTPEQALNTLCRLLTDRQTQEDSRRINPEGMKEEARSLLADFLKELPS